MKTTLTTLILAVLALGISTAADTNDTMVRKITDSTNGAQGLIPKVLGANALVSRDNTIALSAYSGVLTIEGANYDRFQTSLLFVEPTADNTITFGDRSGSVLIGSALDTTGGNLGAVSAYTGIVNSKLIPFGTMTNGAASVKTKALMDDTPAAEFSAVGGTADPTDTQDATYARKGTNSLKLAFVDAAVAGDGVQWTAFAGENWEAQESMGFWMRSSKVLAAGDIVIKTVDSTGDVSFNVPAITVANKWQWVEVDISALAGGTGDAVTNYKIVLSTAGAAQGAFDLYVDGGYKWDSTEELALGVNLVDAPGAVRSVLALVKANTGTHDFTTLVEDTDFFVHTESGNDFLVTITNQSANAAFVLVNHQ